MPDVHEAAPPPPSHVFEPLKPTVNAMEVFLLALALWSSANSAVRFFARTVGPDALLGTPWVIGWTVGLLGGAFVAALGLFWRGRAITAIGLQQLGYTAFAFASLARIVALIGADRVAEVPVIALFALATITRVIQLEVRLVQNRLPTMFGKWRRNGNGNGKR